MKKIIVNFFVIAFTFGAIFISCDKKQVQSEEKQKVDSVVVSPENKAEENKQIQQINETTQNIKEDIDHASKQIQQTTDNTVEKLKEEIKGVKQKINVDATQNINTIEKSTKK